MVIGQDPTGHRSREERLVALAARQHGVVTRAQLLSLGFSPSAILRRLRYKRLTPLHRGVYGVGTFLPPHARLSAAVMACGPDAAISHATAAVLWGLPATATECIHVTITSGARRRHPGLSVHRAPRLEDAERTMRNGVAVTTPVRTLVDLATVANAHELELALATAERERLIAREDLGTLAERYRGHRGIGRLRAIIERTDGPRLTRSEAERRFLSLVRRARLPAPHTNVRLDEYEVDFYWPDHDLAVEVDGYRYHGSRVRFESDRQRATRLAALGVQVVPLTWRQIMQDELATAVQLGQALARGRRSGP